MGERERQIEDRAMGRLKSLGFIAERLVREGTKGWPDDQIMRDGLSVFVEAKRPDGRLSPHQVECHAELRAAGMDVIVADDDVDMVAFVLLWFCERGVLA